VLPFPSPTLPREDAREVLLGYLDYFRSVVHDRLLALGEDGARRTSVPSGWSPVELAHHLVHVERRWLDWGFEGVAVADPWADSPGEDDRWHLDPAVSLREVAMALVRRGEATRAVVLRHDLGEVGAPSPRWDGAPAPTLERVLLHLLQEYARHAGHLDVVCELAGGPTGE